MEMDSSRWVSYVEMHIVLFISLSARFVVNMFILPHLDMESLDMGSYGLKFSELYGLLLMT